MKKIVFFGTPDFAVESLDAIVKAGYDVAAVVTATDKPAGRGHALLQSAVKKYAIEAGIPVLQPQKLRDETFINQLRAIGADLFVVIAFRMMPEVVWAMPPLGTFNLHASLLPRYRGAAPINWAVINGDDVSGVTTFFLSHEIDTGDIIDRVEVPILPSDNVGDLHDKLMHIGAELTVKTIGDIFAGKVHTTPQATLVGDEAPTPAPKLNPTNMTIDWAEPAEKIHNLVRGLSPYPAARATLLGDTFKVYRTALCTDHTTTGDAPGTLSRIGNRLFVTTGSGPLEILELQAPGKRRLPAADWLRGARLD